MKPIIGAVALGVLAIGGGVVLATSRHSANAQTYPAPTPLEIGASADPTAPTAMPAVIDDTTALPQASHIATSGTAPAPRQVV